MSAEADDLELIPRLVRDKLDRVGIKLHLKDWQRLARAERARLRDQACDSPQEVERYRADLEEVVRRRTGAAPERLTGAPTTGG